MSLSAIKGQETAIRMLTGAMERGRVATSYLFAGEEGVGKRLTAVNFAKALNCRAPVDRGGRRDACDECPSCRKTEAGSHPDFLLVEPENGIIKVERIRQLEEALAFRPFEGGIKAVVVDDAEKMNSNAANAFLKTLEEPAAGSLIVLVSSRPDWLPSTIRSRCSRVNFRPLSPSECEEVIGAGRKEAAALARLSMGRPGLAVREDLLKERRRFLDALKRMLAAESKSSWADRRDIERWLDLALLLLRDMMVSRLGGEGGLVNADIGERIGAMARQASVENLMECYGKLRRLRGALMFNLNKGITWNYAGAVLRESKIHV